MNTEEVHRILADLGIERSRPNDILNLIEFTDKVEETDAAFAAIRSDTDEKVYEASLHAQKILLDKVKDVFDWRVRDRFGELPAETRAAICEHFKKAKAQKLCS